MTKIRHSKYLLLSLYEESNDFFSSLVVDTKQAVVRRIIVPVQKILLRVQYQVVLSDSYDDHGYSSTIISTPD